MRSLVGDRVSVEEHQPGCCPDHKHQSTILLERRGLYGSSNNRWCYPCGCCFPAEAEDLIAVAARPGTLRQALERSQGFHNSEDLRR